MGGGLSRKIKNPPCVHCRIEDRIDLALGCPTCQSHAVPCYVICGGFFVFYCKGYSPRMEVAGGTAPVLDIIETDSVYCLLFINCPEVSLLLFIPSPAMRAKIVINWGFCGIILIY